MIRNLIRLTVGTALLATMAGPVSAGGMATVHLDEAPANVTVGVPVEIGFTVMQHDIAPVNVASAYVSAIHRESGKTIEANGIQTGAVGHYVAELTFPAAGSWKWSIIPAPFAGTSFESVLVLEAGAGGDAAPSDSSLLSASVRTGTCAEPGDLAFPLGSIAPADVPLDREAVNTSGRIGGAAEPVAIRVATVPNTIAELTRAPHVVSVHLGADDVGQMVMCGAIGGALQNGELVVGVQQVGSSGMVGIATLSEDERGATVSIYMLVTTDPATTQTTGTTVEVTIVDNQGTWSYNPASLEIEVGTTVVWRNTTDTSHTVTGKYLAFEDSGPFGTGESFQQTFTTPGAFSYFCAPHPFMTGQITVT